MPAVFRQQSHLPLTPPEYFPTYAGCGGVQLNSMQFAIGMGMHEKTGYKPAYGAHETYGSYQYASQEQYGAGMGRVFPSAGLPPPTGMPSELPGLVEEVPRRQEPKRLEPVEERSVGGVSAHLDYEMDEMVEFVATVSQNIIQPVATVPPMFRKFVAQILTSTRLPSSTILLGLEYLSTRMKGLSNSHRSPGHVYRMLTTALLLASKFLDDNTFQNKSWAEVTSIPVPELNALEIEWLTEIGWHLHVDPTGKKGFEIWRQTWENWRGVGAANKVTNDRVLAPINTQIAHRNSIHGTFSPPPTAYPGLIGERVIQLPPPQALQQSQHDSSPSYWWPSADRSPPYASETGPATPDYTFSSNWGVNYSAPTLTPTHHTMRLPSATLPALAIYGHHHQSIWPGTQCGCSHCGRGDYFMSGFGQAVVG
ncbi:hypothetical protein BDZ91DRAFT_773028 [Kalaharituber pfeilii]|nr:hypothetical protein BDZ91DRAFT_773028 [Kalaharituber pfeilii]